jgi:enoyl-CoA hydratase
MHILSERRGPIAIIRLNRREKLNALSREMLAALSEALKAIADDAMLRVVVLTGEGTKAFCAGTDISELQMLDEHSADSVSRRGQSVCEQIETLGIPVVAAINGVAAGGGCELALACHLRIASRNASFSLPETKLGMIPAYGGTNRLAREVGHGRAIEIMLTGRTVGADEALRIGLVNEVADSESLERALDVANEISVLAPLAIQACLEAVRRGMELPLTEGLALERKLFSGLFATKDVREGTRAFLEKRKPVFKGT